MNWTKYIVIVGGLSLGSLAPLISWAQPQHQVAPTGRTALVNGTVLDGQTKQPIVGATVLAKSQDGIVRAQQVTNAVGVYQITLDPKQSYIVTIKADGYADIDEQQVFSDPNVATLHKTIPTLLYRTGIKPPSPKTAAPPVHTAATTVVSPPITRPTTTPPVSEQPAASNTSVVQTSRVAPPKTLDAKVVYTPPPIVAAAGKTTQLQALQFVQSKAELLPDAQSALEQLLAFMREHATAEIELAGHTDNQGDFDENLKLSKQRVEVVKDYLVKNGIAANRVSTRGYGPTRPIASNNSENSRKLNRRVEMTVLKE